MMARTTEISETHTVRDHGKALTFNTSKIAIPKSGLRIHIAADRTDPNWDALNYPARADAFRRLIRETAQARHWRVFTPEVSTQQVIIGFHDKIEEEEGLAFVEEIGFTQNRPVNPPKRAPTKRARS